MEVLTSACGERAADAAGAPGAGAAGGVGYAALAVLGARRRPGVDVVLDLVGFADLLTGARLAITGEGSLDAQTLSGKAPAGVAAAARRAGVPAVAVAGRSLLRPQELAAAGLRAAYALTDIEPDQARCMSEAGPLLEQLAARVAGDWLMDPAAPQARGRPAPGRPAHGKGASTMADSPDQARRVRLFVNGEGMRGGRVHPSIADQPFLGPARTAARYRFWSVGDRFPALQPVDSGGVSVPGELYDVELDVLRDRFIPAEPPEVELGVVELDDGSAAMVVLLRHGTGPDELRDISDAGGWRAYRGTGG